jgi:hypothetical protein
VKVGDYVSFTTYHPSARTFTQHRKGIIVATRQRGNGTTLYSISDGKQTFELVSRGQIHMVWAARKGEP